MIDTQSYLIPLEAKKALLVSDSEWGLDELEGLLKTMGGQAKARMLVNLRRIDPRTYLGAGKLEEIGARLEADGLDMLLVDFDLSPTQFRNVERAIGKLVLDRSGIILEIFNRHARSREAKLQVELARLQYLMPRLTNLWSHFERQRGSGGGALKGKGMGEKQIEVDRRLVKDRVNLLTRKLKDAEAARHEHRKHREALLKVAIVGYTNAGKSTLLNALTRSEVRVEDALFATLDATVRCLNPKSRPIVLGIDTVGFIDRLPHNLVASFRSTLSEVLEADLLVHVIDASDAEVRRHFDVTRSVLDQLGAGRIPMLIVFNKMDRCADASLVRVWGASLMRSEGAPPPLYVSARDERGVAEVREKILAYFERAMSTYEVIVPFEDGKTVASIHEMGRIEAERPTERGTFFRLRTMPDLAVRMRLERYRI